MEHLPQSPSNETKFCDVSNRINGKLLLRKMKTIFFSLFLWPNQITIDDGRNNRNNDKTFQHHVHSQISRISQNRRYNFVEMHVQTLTWCCHFAIVQETDCITSHSTSLYSLDDPNLNSVLIALVSTLKLRFIFNFFVFDFLFFHIIATTATAALCWYFCLHYHLSHSHYHLHACRQWNNNYWNSVLRLCPFATDRIINKQENIANFSDKINSRGTHRGKKETIGKIQAIICLLLLTDETPFGSYSADCLW